MTIDDLQKKMLMDLTAIDVVSDSSNLIVHDGKGMKRSTKQEFLADRDVRIKAVEDLLGAVVADGAGAHNAIYRGKYLGDHVTEEQYAAIKSGKFTDLFIGDYWIIDGVTYIIAAFNYWLNCGDTAFTANHILIVTAKAMYNAQMNGSNTTAGGYVGSAMYTSGLNQAKTTIKKAFNGHVLKHREWLVNAVANGRSSNGLWSDSEIDLMTEQMVYGSAPFSPVSDGSSVPANYRTSKTQLPLFAHDPSKICTRENWWLRDVITAAFFAFVGDAGNCLCYGASNSLGVRPAFCIG